MPGSPKIKPLYLMKIMLDKTDLQNPITVPEIIAELAGYGIKAERKTVYDDLNVLRTFGIDIERVKTKTVGYYVASRLFDLSELKLLVDAVQSSRFITRKKSESIIQKLSTLTSMAQAKQLNRQVYVIGRAKAFNESALYNVDAIYEAINNGKKISFRYFKHDLQKNRVYRKNGNLYKVTPLAMTWNDDKYYLIANYDEHNEIRHYRVDRMSDAMMLDEGGAIIEKFNIAEYNRHMFGMFRGELVQATLSFDNSLVNVVLDQFGEDIILKPAEDGHFNITVDVSVSPVFLGWMFQLGHSAAIKGPEKLVTAMRQHLEENLKKYFQ